MKKQHTCFRVIRDISKGTMRISTRDAQDAPLLPAFMKDNWTKNKNKVS